MATLRYELPAAEARSLQAHLALRGYHARLPLRAWLGRGASVSVVVDVDASGGAQVDALVRRLAPGARSRSETTPSSGRKRPKHP